MPRLWEVSSGRCVRTIERNHSWDSVYFSPDGRYCLSGGYHSTLRLLEISSGRCLRTFEGHSDTVTSSCFSADGRYCLSGSYDQTLRLWEVSSGRCLRIFEGHTREVRSVCFSPDGRYCLSGSNDKTLRLWEVSSGRCLRTFQGHTYKVASVCFSPDGRYCLSGSDDETLRLWEVSSGRCLRTFQGHTDSVKSVCFSPDGHYCLLGSWREGTPPRLWDVSLYLGNKHGVDSVLSQPLDVEEVTRRNRHFAELLDKVAYHHSRGNESAALECLGSARGLSGKGFVQELLDWNHSIGRHCRVKSFLSGRVTRTFEGHTDIVCSVTFSPDGRFCLSGSEDETLRLWEVSSGDCLRIFRGKTRSIHSVSFSSDGRHCLSASRYEPTLRLWDVSTGECLRTFEGHTVGFASNAVVGSSCFSPDGRYCLSGGNDKTLRLWEVSSGRCLRIFQVHTDTDDGYVVGRDDPYAGVPKSVCFSPDGRYCLSGSYCLSAGSYDETLRLWEVSSGQCLRTYPGHEASVGSISFSPSGHQCISGSADHTLRLWEISSGRCLRTFEGHDGGVASVSVSPNGRHCLSGSGDKTIRLWDISSGKCLRTFVGHTDIVCSVRFSPDGRFCLSGSKDKTTRLWELVWEYEFPGWSDWDDDARPYLEHFLTIHCPTSNDGTIGVPKPEWQPKDFEMLIEQLQHRGLGYIRPEGVRKKLEEMAADWNGPPPLPSQDTSE